MANQHWRTALQATGVLLKGNAGAVLDNMDIERERGITIRPRLSGWFIKVDGGEYILTLLTPGHVDFNYEVSRSLAACEGAILAVDAARAWKPKRLRTYMALEHNLEIMPVINKIDLPGARRTSQKEIENDRADCSDAPLISAKTGLI